MKSKELYFGTKLPMTLKDKIAILVDHGVATGQTLLSSIEFIIKQQPFKIAVALPVGPPSTLKKIKELPSVNRFLCLLAPDNFQAVRQFYKEFGQVDDQEAIRLFTHS
jgi:predicted phosphoribosyltransferase